MINHRPARIDSTSPALFGATIEIVARPGWPIRMVCIAPGQFGGSHVVQLTPGQARKLAADLLNAAESVS